MFLDDKTYQIYCEEMEALENFRMAHLAPHRDTPIELLEDPDTLRLVESLAFFAARSRVHGLKKVAQIHQVLFRQYFSFLINPLPAMGLLQIHPSLRIPDKTHIPQNSELIGHTYDKRKAAFQFLNDVTVSPLFFEKFNFYRQKGGDWHLEMTYSSPHRQNEDLEEFTLYINHMNSFFTSLRAYFGFIRSLESVQVHYDESNVSNKEGSPCEYFFGTPKNFERKEYEGRINQSQRIIILYIFYEPYHSQHRHHIQKYFPNLFHFLQLFHYTIPHICTYIRRYILRFFIFYKISAF